MGLQVLDGWNHAINAGSSVALSTTSAIVMRFNAKRMIATITNIDTAINIFLAFGPTAAANSGILITPNGGNIIFGRATDLPWTGEISAIAASGTPTIILTEVSEV